MSKQRRPYPTIFLGVGLELAGTVGVLVGIGYWVDRHYQTSPIFTLVGAGIGIVGGLTKIVLQSSQTMRNLQRKQRDENQTRK
ncbi:AtpZ/AtpI family protein [Planctomycetales bacterium ZRK34]|nr:AtpZ/AtpI family protein [Planctomycetales bacterium ZRK34]